MRSLLGLLASVAFVAACGDDATQLSDTATPSDITASDTQNQTPEDTHVPPRSDTGSTDVGTPDTGPATSDTGPTAPDTDPGTPDTAPPDPTNFINEGFIGGPCDVDADCGYEGGFCLSEAAGFPNGMCSAPCEKFCPDQEGMVMTFCIDGPTVEVNEPPGLCTMRCDFGLSENGCRPGYKCVELPRFNDPSVIIPSCVPSEGPGEAFDPVGPTSCQKELTALGIGYTVASNPKASPDGHPNLICDIKDPIKVDGVMHGVSYRYDTLGGTAKPIFSACALALALEKMALLLSANGVTDLLHWGVYNCRVVSGTNKLSQHGLAAAIDIRGLVFDDGVQITVLDDWEKDTDAPLTDAGQYLKWFVETLFADGVFNILLTPNYNAAHKDHFHLDLTPGSEFLD